jgi:hypothetical protein
VTSRPEHTPGLDDRAIDAALGEAQANADAPESDAERTVALIHREMLDHRAMPEHLRHRLLAESPARGPASQRTRRNPWPALAAAASLAVAAGLGVWAWRQQAAHTRTVETLRAQLEEAQRAAASNAQLLANADAAVERLRASLTEREGLSREQAAALADAEARTVDLARQLADTAARLSEAELTIARYEAPQDPAILAEDRQLLLEVPDTVRLAWSPFALPDAPPPVRAGVTGDVVWNDRLQTGYLRFVGLDPNDPNIEQYQVWVIDERGMEQKVSGGVFDVNKDGEVIVPIDPGIPVGRVALFAVTVEDPGGTWVPDLRRRVVVAPRSDG